MSAPRTNVETQEKKHAGPLIIMAGCIAFAALIVGAFLVFSVDEVEDDAPAAVTAPAD